MATNIHAAFNDRIVLTRPAARVHITLDDRLIVDTDAAIHLAETGYPPRWYLPRADVDRALLRESATRTHCPFKGDARYFGLQHDNATLTDAAWCYDTPLPGLEAIAGYLAFDHPRLTLHIEHR